MLAKNNSSRQLKVAALIQECLMQILQRCKQLDSRLLENRLTITTVKVSADLKIASCYFLPFGINKINDKELLEALDFSKSAIRYQLTQEINLKFSPELRFFYDHSFKNVSDVEEALQRISIEKE